MRVLFLNHRHPEWRARIGHIREKTLPYQYLPSLPHNNIYGMIRTVSPYDNIARLSPSPFVLGHLCWDYV
jgi:hypothetical protein